MKKTFLICYFAVLLILLPQATFAFQLIPEGCTGPNVTAASCGLDEIFITFINFANFLLSIVGSVALLMFVYGGFVWLTSGGASEKIKKGRDIMVNTAIGIAIVFGAATVIYSVGTTLCAGDQQCINQLNIYRAGGGTRSGIDCSLPENDGKACGTEKNMVCSYARSACLSKCEASEDYAAQGYRCMNVSVTEKTEAAANAYAKDNPCIVGLCPGDWDYLCCKPHEAVVVNTCCSCNYTGSSSSYPKILAQTDVATCWNMCFALIRLEEGPISDDDIRSIIRMEYHIDPSANETCREAIERYRTD